jgi:Phosphotransferase enzyme family
VWVGEAKAIAPAFARRLGVRPWLLRGLDLAVDRKRRRSEVVVELELPEPLDDAPAHGRWFGRDELGRLPLADERHLDILGAYLVELEGGSVPKERPPWARPGWYPEVRAWIEGEVARLGHVVREIEQVKHWSISAILRVETEGPELYFKVPARLPLFADEAVLTRRLAQRFPRVVPLPLAVEPERGWMLLSAFDELLGWDAPPEAQRESLRRFAELQIATIGSVAELLADGCLDRRLDVLEAQIDPLLADPRAVLQLEADEVAELRRLAPELKDLCRRLAALAIPPTLVHGDLHLANVARIGGELRFFDWTDACVAHPFMDLLSLQWEQDETKRAAALDAYLEPWHAVAPAERLREAVRLARVVIPLHHAVSYAHIVAGVEPTSKPELDATHTFLREALARVRELVRPQSAD